MPSGFMCVVAVVSWRRAAGEALEVNGGVVVVAIGSGWLCSLGVRRDCRKESRCNGGFWSDAFLNVVGVGCSYGGE